MRTLLVCLLVGSMTALAQAQAQHQLSPRAEERIQREVFHELNMLPHYSIFDILSYQVQGSTVILSGKVRDPGLQKSAEDAVRHIEGVEKVVNKIQVLPGFPDDERIRVHIARSFWDTGLMRYMMGGAPPIRIIVAAGKVTLEGIVGNEGDKAIARAKAAGVPGVISVENNLRVEK